MQLDKKNIGLYGLSFKQGTDDLRESPLVSLAEILIGKGYSLKIYDQFVKTSKLVGGNKAYINNKLPHLSNLLVNHVEELNDVEVIIIAHNAPKNLIDNWIESNINIVDLNHPGGDFYTK